MSQKTIDMLNNAFKSDPNAIWSLTVNRIPCNKALADDPYIGVDTCPIIECENFQVGFLGLINGIMRVNDMPLIAIKFSEKNEDGRSIFLGFCEYTGDSQ